MRELNGNLRALSATFAHSDPIAFFCECQNPSCFAPVWMSVTAFDATVTGKTSWLLSEGHEPSTLWHVREPLPIGEAMGSRHAAAPARIGRRRPAARHWRRSSRHNRTRSNAIGTGLRTTE